MDASDTTRSSAGAFSWSSKDILTRCRSQFFPIAVKLNPLNQFGRIGRADEVFAHEIEIGKDTPISWCIKQEIRMLGWFLLLFLVTCGGSLFLLPT
jgi:hypothetical protein